MFRILINYGYLNVWLILFVLLFYRYIVKIHCTHLWPCPAKWSSRLVDLLTWLSSIGTDFRKVSFSSCKVKMVVSCVFDVEGTFFIV